MANYHSTQQDLNRLACKLQIYWGIVFASICNSSGILEKSRIFIMAVNLTLLGLDNNGATELH